MISKEQASNAIQYLEAAAMNMLFEDEAHKQYNDNMRKGAVAILRDYIAQHEAESHVKIVYEYKLRRGDGKLLNKSSWDEKGKTYKNKGALKSALGQFISAFIESDKNKPTFKYVTHWESLEPEQLLKYKADYDRYNAASIAWREHTQSKEVRATYIPEDWIVIAIAVNTAQQPKEMSAREWYRTTVKDSA
jgi:hypothetical protein